MSEHIMLTPEELVFSSGTQTTMDRTGLATSNVSQTSFVSNVATRQTTQESQGR